jgi:hypothetical protein
MVVLVPGGPYADEVEQRRRIRYAVLAGFQSTRMKPVDSQHINCLKREVVAGEQPQEMPYELFLPDPLADADTGKQLAYPRIPTLVIWLKEEALGKRPLQALDGLRSHLSGQAAGQLVEGPLKVIGPSTSTTLSRMYQEAPNAAVEVYSPLVTVESRRLANPQDRDGQSSNIVRTTSDDGVLTALLLDELARRNVDVVRAVACEKDMPRTVGNNCDDASAPLTGRVALISEWDSFYARALTETFKAAVVEKVDNAPLARQKVDDWVLSFSYLRGLDGRLSDQAKSDDKKIDNNKKSGDPLDLSPLETPDGNSQLDYLRRLADHIASQDQAYRRAGEPGIEAIGVLGTDAYDKLLALQALKGRLPDKVYFSTNLDARMLQRGQAQITRNLVLAAPYGLTLTRALQQDVPPFRDSAQSATFVAVLTALSGREFGVKKAAFDAGSSLLSPGIYEVGISGFIPLGRGPAVAGSLSCEVPDKLKHEDPDAIRSTPDILGLPQLQDQPPPVYPEMTDAGRAVLDGILDYMRAPWLAGLLLGLSLVVGFWWTERQAAEKVAPAWVCRVPFGLYVAAALCLVPAKWHWEVAFLWLTFLLIMLGVLASRLLDIERRRQHDKSTEIETAELLDSPVYYILPPFVILVLALLLGYQMRRCLTDNGAGEPMFLFEGISVWPSVALRCLAIVISLSALAWGWRRLRINAREIQRDFCLPPYRYGLWHQLCVEWCGGRGEPLRARLGSFGFFLFRIFVPLAPVVLSDREMQADHGQGGHKTIWITRLWDEHCLCGSFGARLLRAALATWVFVTCTSVLYAFWPMNILPIRGHSSEDFAMRIIVASYFAFYLLVFWVVDANFLLVRFINRLVPIQAIWPAELSARHQKIFGIDRHICIDDWVDMVLIAQRSSAVNRLIYAPTVVLLIMIASRSSLFDAWPTPPSTIFIILLTAAILFISALWLRRAAEKARGIALGRLDAYLLEEPSQGAHYEKFKLIRERIVALNTGAFSRYSEEPLVRALLLSLTGIGGSVVVDALNFAKF